MQLAQPIQIDTKPLIGKINKNVPDVFALLAIADHALLLCILFAYSGKFLSYKHGYFSTSFTNSTMSFLLSLFGNQSCFPSIIAKLIYSLIFNFDIRTSRSVVRNCEATLARNLTWRKYCVVCFSLFLLDQWERSILTHTHTAMGRWHQCWCV